MIGMLCDGRISNYKFRLSCDRSILQRWSSCVSASNVGRKAELCDEGGTV